MTDELKPCPFCGGKAEYGLTMAGEEVYCTACYANMPRTTTADEAISRWNARAERTCSVKGGVGGWFCSECGVFVNNDCIADAQRWIAPRYCANCGAKIKGGQA